MGKKCIIVAGHISLDITPIFTHPVIMGGTEIVAPGKLTSIGKAHIHLGGCVANTGLALHKLGADVTLVAKTGYDTFGQIIKEEISKTGCEFHFNVTDTEDTSYTIVIAPEGMDRAFLHYPGCNHTFKSNEIDFDKVSQATHFHFGYPTLMRQFYINEGEELVRLFKRVKELGVTTSLDLAAVDQASEAGQCNWKKILSKVLPWVDFFVPSLEELVAMIAPEVYKEWEKRANGKEITSVLSINQDIKWLANQALEMGCKSILLKCGSAGMFLKTASGEQVWQNELKSWNGIECFEYSYVPDRVVSATGAGDTSIAAFLKAMTEGYTPYECLQFAAATGACCVTTYDTTSGLLSFEQIQERLSEGWAKQILIKQ